MAGAKTGWRNSLLAVALCLTGAWADVWAQSGPTGTLAGKLTDLYAHPLAGVAVTARNEATGEEAQTTTAKNGSYLFLNLSAGFYTLQADSAGLGRGRLEGIQVSAGHTERLVTAMAFEPLPAETPAVELARTAEPPPAEIPRRPVWTPPAPAQIPAESVLLAAEIPPQTMELLVLAARPLLQQTAQAVVSLQPVPSAAAGRALSELAIQTALATPPAARIPLATNDLQTEPILRTVDSAASSGQRMDAEIVQDLPASGRRWQDFLPEAKASDSAGRATNSGASLDGINVGLLFGQESRAPQAGQGQSDAGQSGSNRDAVGSSAAEGRGFVISELALREVTLLSSSAAGAEQHGNYLESRSGGNDLHGQALLFTRQNMWGAQNPFTQWVKMTALPTMDSEPTLSTAAYTLPSHETTFGFGAGRRIRRDRAFWFAAFDGSNKNDPAVATVRHPAQFFTLPKDADTSLPTIAERLTPGTPTPTTDGLKDFLFVLKDLAGLLGPAPRSASQWAGFARVDEHVGERQRYLLEFSGSNRNAPGGGLSRVAEPYGSHSFGSSQSSTLWLHGQWERYFSENLLAVTHAAVARTIVRQTAGTPSGTESKLLAYNMLEQLPQININTSYGFTIGNPARFGAGTYPDEESLQARQTLDWAHGHLLIKSGFEMIHSSDATSLTRNGSGTFTYSSLANFVSDYLAFQSFHVSGQLNPYDPHNCDVGEKDVGYLPCYSYFTQTLGPGNWWIASNDWSGFGSAQWQPRPRLTLTAGLRWQRQQMPAPMAKVDNPDLRPTEHVPATGNTWAPRVSVAWGSLEDGWPVLRLGYGLYAGRTENGTLLTALSQTGSLAGNRNYFLRPTDNLQGGGAPPFPQPLTGSPGTVVKPGATEFASGFRNPQVHQAEASLEERLPGHILMTASAEVSLGRRLPVVMDTNFDATVNPQTITYDVVDSTGTGPIHAATLTVPFYASWPSSSSTTGFAGRANTNYQQINQLQSRANSTYEAVVVSASRMARSGLSFHARYTYGHAMDWNPDESPTALGSAVLDPANFRAEYGTSNLDRRHAAWVLATWRPALRLREPQLQRVLADWRLSGVFQAHSGLPYTMRTSGALAKEFLFTSNSSVATPVVALGPGINGSGGDNRLYAMGRNTFQYPATWKLDLRLARRFDLGHMRDVEAMIESFNLFNHQNVTELETIGYTISAGAKDGTHPKLTFLNGSKANTTAFGQPLNVNATDFYRERQVQFGLRMRF